MREMRPVCSPMGEVLDRESGGSLGSRESTAPAVVASLQRPSSHDSLGSRGEISQTVFGRLSSLWRAVVPCVPGVGNGSRRTTGVNGEITSASVDSPKLEGAEVLFKAALMDSSQLLCRPSPNATIIVCHSLCVLLAVIWNMSRHCGHMSTHTRAKEPFFYAQHVE